MTQFRPFRNSDPPGLVKLWNQTSPERGTARPLRVHELDAHAFGTVNFEADGLIVAERDGRIVGSVFLVRKSATVAKLRLLLVEPQARGLGIGRRLIDECVRFARASGYRKITLWTQNDLHAARHLYALAGFRRMGAQAHDSFGKKLVAETWELALPPANGAKASRRSRP